MESLQPEPEPNRPEVVAALIEPEAPDRTTLLASATEGERDAARSLLEAEVEAEQEALDAHNSLLDMLAPYMAGTTLTLPEAVAAMPDDQRDEAGRLAEIAFPAGIMRVR